MRNATIILLTLINTITFSQSFKNKLQGEWVCTEIRNENGDKTSGLFGHSDEYLRFSFSGSSVAITETAFDTPRFSHFKYTEDSIDTSPFSPENFDGRKYAVKSINNNNLILTTTNKSKEIITYFLVNQSSLLARLKSDKPIIDHGLIIIKHLKPSKDSKGANRAYEYAADSISLYPSPIFYDYSVSNFGYYFTINFEFPKEYPLETVSKEVVVDFDVTDKGVENIKIVKGTDNEMNAAILKVLKGTRKKWRPVKMDGDTISTTIRFHFVSYISIVPLPFKIFN